MPTMFAPFYDSYAWHKMRQAIRIRDGGRCRRCGTTPANPSDLHVDHIVSLRDDWSRRLDAANLVLTCRACHGKKTGKDVARRNAARRGELIRRNSRNW